MEKLEYEGNVYELTDKIPEGYTIWYIGKHMLNGYLPLCQCDKNYHINPDTLKAIKCDDAQNIMNWCALATTKKEYKNRFAKIVEKFNN